MRGDRFKKRLPKFVGKIPDLDDTFYAEDKEFERIDKRLKGFGYGLIASLLKSEEDALDYLARFEKDYGLEGVGSIEDRIKEVILKIGAKKVTTEDVILDLCKTLGLPARFTPKYDKYGFLLDLILGDGGADLDKLNKAIREVAPAHLEDEVHIHFGKSLVLKSQHGLDAYLIWLCGENLCGDVPYVRSVGRKIEADVVAKTGAFDSRNYYGMPSKDLKSADLYGYDLTEIRYMQDVRSVKTYDFGGKK